MIRFDPSRSLDEQLAAIQDMPDRIASVLIALVNGDEQGAQAVMAGADTDLYVHVLHTLCLDLGQRVYSRDGFARQLRVWAEKVRALDPHNPQVTD